MKRLATLAALAILLTAGFPVQSAPTSSTFATHASIFINTDANFTAAKGVVAGTGTSSDPYIIAGWHITASYGTAIRITNVTKSFVIRDNLIIGYHGVHIDDSTSAKVVIEDNQILSRAAGVKVTDVKAHIRGNAFYPDRPAVTSTTAIELYASDSIVEANLIATFGIGVKAELATPIILNNDIHFSSTGVRLDQTIGANVSGNIITDPVVAGIYLNFGIGSNVTGNNITTSWGKGIEVWANKDVNIANNSIRYSAGVGVAFETTSGNFTGNVVLDGKTDAVTIWHSPLLMTNNTIVNNLGIGFHFQMSAADARANVFVRNGIGIALRSSDVVHIKANVLVNNTIGLDIPYDARQSIIHLEANIVNGVNIDGTLNPAERVYFYGAANVTITGQVRDSGFSAGYYGSLTAQGGVVLYEVDTANINGTIISHHQVGVGVVNSFDVNVRGSVLASNRIGVYAEARNVPFVVPPCVVFVKDTNITIPVDPPATLGIHAKGCGTFVVNASISLVDIGIKLEAASGAITNTNITGTSAAALDISSSASVNLTGNTIADNPAGIKLRASAAVLVDNNITRNAAYGVRFENGVSARMLGNNVSHNGEGVIDTRACLGAGTCSSVDTEQNVFFANRGDGLRVNGVSHLRGDLFLANRGTGAKLGSATIIGLESRANEADGLSITGTFTLRDSKMSENKRHGFDLVGQGSIRSSQFTRNDQAGIRATATYVTALQLNVSENLDGILFDELVPRVQTPPTVSVPGALAILPALTSGDPLDIHLSVIERNLRDGIRANAAVINATHNYFGDLGPRFTIADTIGAFGNGVTPTARVVPWYADRAMTTTGPVPLL